MCANPRTGFQVPYEVHFFDTGRFLAQLEVDDGRAGSAYCMLEIAPGCYFLGTAYHSCVLEDVMVVDSCTAGVFDGLRGLCLRDISENNVPTPFESITFRTLRW